MGIRFGGRYVLRVTPADVGSRVTLRYRLPEGRLTDVVGVLESWADDTLTVAPRDGSVVAVPAAALVASKVIPPRAT